jgi:hypothetical protein
LFVDTTYPEGGGTKGEKPREQPGRAAILFFDAFSVQVLPSIYSDASVTPAQARMAQGPWRQGPVL